MLPGAVRLFDRRTVLGRHVDRMHFALGAVPEVQVRAVTTGRIVSAGAGRIAALAARLGQRALHHRLCGLFEFLDEFILTTHYVVRYQNKIPPSSPAHAPTLPPCEPHRSGRKPGSWACASVSMPRLAELMSEMRPKFNRDAAQALEGVSQQQQLALGVRGSALHTLATPR